MPTAFFHTRRYATTLIFRFVDATADATRCFSILFLFAFMLLLMLLSPPSLSRFFADAF